MTISTIPWANDMPNATSDEAAKKDWAYWQNRINRASLVMLVEQGILESKTAKTIAAAQVKAETQQDNPSKPRIRDIMPLEKMLIEECGQLATLIHTGRSRQDIFATLYQMRLRLQTLDFFDNLLKLRSVMCRIATEHTRTYMPAYTNGVQAMPITLGFYLWAFLESFERDSDRISEAYHRINRSALGSAVLANSGWPLSRERLAELLGFDGPIINSLDSSQVSLFDIPIEASNIASNVAVRITTLVQDLAQQYSQTRPWMLLESGAAYSSSAMPQKRNPGILNKTRAKAGDVIGAAATVTLRAHNLPLGMYDNKGSATEDDAAVLVHACTMLQLMTWAFGMLKVNKERALEELENDWTCTMALAEKLQRVDELPFRVGHSFASEIVTVARREGYLPKTFPYEEAKRIFRSVCEKLEWSKGEFPLDEASFRAALTPSLVVESRLGTGSPNPFTVESGLEHIAKRLSLDEEWLAAKRKQISKSVEDLDARFDALLNL